MKNEPAQMTSSGVDALIERLKEQGIAAGQEKAESIVLNAQKRAEWIINEATLEAQVLIKNAKAETEAIKAAGEDALKLAARDAYLKLRDSLSGSFCRKVMRVVGKKMADKKFLEKLILTLAGQVRNKTGLDQAKHVEILLPENLVGTDDLRSNTEELQDGALSHFVGALAADLLRAGVKFEVSDELSNGLLLKLKDDNIVIDFTDEAVATLLLEHLQPRFHALMEGIIQ
jgi:V/A-type H+/Na+-transporting ATPase subunit E